ncbi:MAG: GGDEF-domain containing protein [Methylocystis sp.]|nr:MAG: GGDEF-domain containing protein [Methylocystis sp.]
MTQAFAYTRLARKRATGAWRMLQAFYSKVRIHLNRLRGALTYPADPLSAARLQSEQYAAVRQNTPGMMAANVCNALVLVATLADTALATRAMLWCVILFAVTFYIFIRSRRRGAIRHATGPTSVGRRAVAYALALGSVWATVPLLFFLESGPGARLMVISLTAGMMFGGAFSLSRAPLAATAFATPVAVAATITLIGGHDANLANIAIVLWIYLSVLLWNVYVEAASFKDRVLTQIGSEREARTDALTGLPNRLAFADAMAREFGRMQRSGSGFLLLCVDLDDFKTVNDRFGHPAGDELLAEAARRMRSCLRVSDVVARLGGDEFAIIATDVTSDDAAIVLADRIVACFGEAFMLDGVPVHSSASVGGALASKDGHDQRELMKCADLALYEAKRRGDCWRLFEVAHDPRAGEARAMEHDLRRALSMEQFEQVYAPIADLASGEIVACEAKLRWRHPTRGAIASEIFLPIAERIGVAHEIGFREVELACAAAAAAPDRLRITVNVSPAQFERPDFAERVLEALTRADVAPGRIELEISEWALPGRQAGCGATALKLSRAGVGLCLGDFGAGYASLEHLRKLPLARVNIHRGLVRDLPAADCAAIVRGIAGMAGALGLGVAAQGVDSATQLEWLSVSVGCEAQGAMIAEPMSAQELGAFIRDWRPKGLLKGVAAGERVEKRA